MRYVLNFILLLGISTNKFSFGLSIKRRPFNFNDLFYICDREKCSNNSGSSLSPYDCHCDENCGQFGTCCINSQYVPATRPKLKPTCRKIPNDENNYLMVDHCPASDSIWESECREKVSYGDNPDILKITPVTSLLTSVTYKNYFCFRCHETNDEFVYWKVQLWRGVKEKFMQGEEIKSDIQKKRYSLTNDNGKWIASFRNDTIRFNLRLLIAIPDEIKPLIKECVPSLITKCSSEWTEFDFIEKCQAYMGVKGSRRNSRNYKNVHCALCNFEDLDDVTCRMRDSDVDGVGLRKPKVTFSFTVLLDINISDGDEVGKIKKCDNDHVWDRYAGRCRKLHCALPGYMIKNGKCELR